MRPRSKAVAALLMLAGAAACSGASEPAGAGRTRLTITQPAPASTPTWNNLPVHDGSLELWVDKVESARRVVPELFGKPAYNLGRTAQGQFVIVYVTVTNIGGVRGQFIEENQALFDDQDRRYSPVPEVAAFYNTAKFHDPIRVAGRVRGVLVFEAPRGLTNFEVELHESVSSGGTRVPIYVGATQPLITAGEVA